MFPISRILLLALPLCLLACSEKPSAEEHVHAHSGKPAPPLHAALREAPGARKPGDLQLTFTVTPEISGTMTVAWTTPEGMTLIEAPETDREAVAGTPEVFTAHFAVPETVSGRIAASVRITSTGGIFGETVFFPVGDALMQEMTLDGEVVREKSTGEAYFQIEGKTVIDGEPVN